MLRPAILAIVVASACGVESGLPGVPADPPSPSPGAGSGDDQPIGTISRGPYLQHADGGVAVVWYTREPTAGRLRWQVEESTGEAPSSEGLGTRHEAVIAPLRPGARYTYRVHSALGRLAAPGGKAEFSFQAPQADVARFVVFGDSGEASAAQQAVARAIAAEPVPPDFVLIVGDVNQPPPGESDPPASGAASYDRRFFEPYEALLPSIPFYAALGNHDHELEKGRTLLDLLTLPGNGPPGRPPESAYWLERAGVQLIVHDTNQPVSSVVEEAVPWHQEVARRPATFRLAFQHHPLYGSGPNAALFPTGPLRDVLAPLYTQTGVDVAFNGHDHLYERTKPVGGVVYVTTGAGGAALYPRATENDFTAAFVNDRHGYTYVEVRDRTLSLRQVDENRQQVDGLQLTKPVAASDALRAFDGPGAPPRGWAEPAFDDSGWPEAGPTPFASALRARRRFEFVRAGDAAEAFLRVRGTRNYVVRLNGVAVARGVDAAEAAFPVAPSLLRRGTNVLALEGVVDGSGEPAPSLELSLVSSPPR